MKKWISLYKQHLQNQCKFGAQSHQMAHVHARYCKRILSGYLYCVVRHLPILRDIVWCDYPENTGIHTLLKTEFLSSAVALIGVHMG